MFYVKDVDVSKNCFPFVSVSLEYEIFYKFYDKIETF